ncbi:YkgJ family cysteine cluster protein [Desulfolucanica intricata]|uniref:YkgJ family cysteine cluster protein n=1 Tax=Desulfolucanica intricata TaxID=1285191 RepID=UPI00083774ED|nr:YkgJ family cysteine cluster protein [Desulfolucanica intricata]
MVIKFHQQIYNALESESLKEIDLDFKFTFGCTEDCMGSCCMMIDILLDPWDVETMARYLNTSGQEFVQKYCLYEIGNGSDWPHVKLKDAASGPCTFLKEDGKCEIYPVRPRNCRTAPVGRAVRFNYDGEQVVTEEKIFMIPPTETCAGFETGRQWTVREWFQDADAFKYYKFSDHYTELINYALVKLSSRKWMSSAIARMMSPFLYGPEILRAKLGISEEEVSHEEFYLRRIKALKVILTDMAAGFGFGPLAEQFKAEGTGAMFAGSMMDRVKKILLP